MKKSSLLFIFLLVLIFSCDKENTSNSQISGEITNHSDCKSMRSVIGLVDIADSLSCIHYSYDASNHKLMLKHYNAGFNCCPGTLYCETELRNDTLIIREFESKQDCDCICLFDLDIELKGIQAQPYLVVFDEPYADDMDELIFEMDLSYFKEGDYCVIRKESPWGP